MMKAGTALSFIAALAGCELSVPTSQDAPSARPAVATVRSVSIAQGEIDVRAPKGYCIEESSLRDTEKGSFVVLGSCKGFSGRARPEDAMSSAVLTLSASAPLNGTQSLSPEALEDYFSSEVGKAALARSGDPAKVDLLGIERGDGAIFIHARDTSAGVVDGLASDYWRAMTIQANRLISVTATAFDHSPMEDDRLVSLLEKFLTSLR